MSEGNHIFKVDVHSVRGKLFILLFKYYLNKSKWKYRIYYTPKKEHKDKGHGAFRDCKKEYAEYGRIYLTRKKTEKELNQMYKKWSEDVERNKSHRQLLKIKEIINN